MDVNAHTSATLTSVPTESDTSDHSYNAAFRTMSANRERSPQPDSPFARAALELPPIERDVADVPPPAPHLWQRMGFRSRSDDLPPRNLRVSFDLPRMPRRALDGHNVDAVVVKKRRRIPVWMALGFGLVTCTGMAIAVSMMPLTIYNYRRIRSQRAARTVDDLGRTLVPLVEAIYNHTVGAKLP